MADTIVVKLASPEPGSEFVRSIAEALDAGELQITELKKEQRQSYDELARQVGCYSSHLATIAGSCLSWVNWTDIAQGSMQRMFV